MRWRAWLLVLLVAWVAEMPLVRATFRIDAQLSAGVWTSLRDDISAAERFTWRRGMPGSGPQDILASTGTLEFGLKNFAQAGQPRLQGWYSPNHVNVRSGWTFGIPLRVVATYNGSDQVLWRGKLRSVDPIPGQYGPRRVKCLATDAMDDFANTEVREVDPQVNQSEVTCLQKIIAAMPADARPVATSYDTALETFPYALDNVSGGVVATTALMDVLDSCQGRAFVKADGTFRYLNRHTWSTTASDFTFTEAMLEREGGIVVPSDLSNVFNDVSATAHPKTQSAGVVLCGITGAQYVGAGETITIWLDYSDPNNRDRLIGAIAFTTPLVENTDYDAHANSDGTGTDLSANLTISVSPFAASARFTVTNNGTTGAYLVNGLGTPLLQLRGTAIYDNAPETRRSTSTQSYGVRRLEVDLKYQASGAFAAAAAAFIEAQYRTLADQCEAIHFNPQRSDALMTEALTAEIGDVKTVSETMTGVSNLNVLVQAIEMDVTKGDYLMPRYVTSPKSPFVQWQLGLVTVSELSGATKLGF